MASSTTEKSLQQMQPSNLKEFEAAAHGILRLYKDTNEITTGELVQVQQGSQPQESLQQQHEDTLESIAERETAHPEICHVVYLKSIEIRAGCLPPYALPFFNDDPLLQSHSNTQHNHNGAHPAQPFSSSSSSTNDSTTTPTSALTSLNMSTEPLSGHEDTSVDPELAAQQMAALSMVDTHGLEELPTCPVCLERMDSSVTGLLTILCQHTFHCHCLSKWGEGSCPVCRYSQKSVKGSSSTRSGRRRRSLMHGSGGSNRNMGARHTTSTEDGLHNGNLEGVPEQDEQDDDMDDLVDDQEENVCVVCGTNENLWICLICGHIGCGRYQEKHAYSHYYESSHLYALELETQRVWDYAGDGYVHRLIQNKTDGKLVELPSAIDGQLPSQHSVQVGQEKLDAIGLEYTYLLTSQLESQRLYFDAQMAAMTAQLAAVNKEAKQWENEAVLLSEKNQRLAELAEQLEKEKPALLKEKKAAEKRLEKMQEKLAQLERQYEEEKEMNESLRTNQDSFREKLLVKEEEILELQEQVRDMMIYLDTQQKVEASPLKDELVNGTIGVVVAPQHGNGAGSSSSGNHHPSSSSSPSGHTRRKGGGRK
ncbi:hypothetical protein BGZ94_000358 [Podila epigama]|nr:hypothetical protein BGZ94_000358 [Podila epigama]